MAVACVAGGAVARGADPPADPPRDPDATVRVVLPRSPHIKKRANYLGDEWRTPDDGRKPWWRWEHATGDWGGRRPALHESGFIPELVYTTQLLSNVSGGDGSGTRIAGNLDLSLTVDTGLVGLWRGGTFFLLFQNLVGRGLSEKVGSFQPIGNLDEDDFVQLSSFYYQQAFLDERLTVRVGKSDANVGFVDSVWAEPYVNGGVSPAENIPLPNYPHNSFGVAVFADPNPAWTLAAGAYGAEADGAKYDGHGFFEGDVFAIGELTWKPKPWGLPGHYNVGAWLSTLEKAEPTSDPDPRRFDENYGAYALFDQWLYREHPEGDQGLVAWFQFSWAPADRNQNDVWVGGGLVYTGLVPGRDDDTLAFAATSADLEIAADGTRPDGAEVTFEWYYEIALAPWFAVKPDIQYVLEPGGNGRNALVIGVEWTVTF